MSFFSGIIGFMIVTVQENPMFFYGCISGIIGIIIVGALMVYYYRKYERIATYLARLKTKSHAEQDLSLATMDQIMHELSSRASAFILILPDASNVRNLEGMKVFVRGFPPTVAGLYLHASCFAIMNGAISVSDVEEPHP